MCWMQIVLEIAVVRVAEVDRPVRPFVIRAPHSAKPTEPHRRIKNDYIYIEMVRINVDSSI